MTKKCPNCDQTPVQPCPVESTSVHLGPPSWSQNTEPIVRVHRQNRYCRLFDFASSPSKRRSYLITPTFRFLPPLRSNFRWAFFILAISYSPMVMRDELTTLRRESSLESALIHQGCDQLSTARPSYHPDLQGFTPTKPVFFREYGLFYCGSLR